MTHADQGKMGYSKLGSSFRHGRRDLKAEILVRRLGARSGKIGREWSIIEDNSHKIGGRCACERWAGLQRNHDGHFHRGGKSSLMLKLNMGFRDHETMYSMKNLLDGRSLY